MKRLLPAIMSALALHAIILSTDFSWLKLAPGPVPTSRSLSITLSADTYQKHKEQAAVETNESENRFQPDLQQKPKEKAAGIPAEARLENSAQIQTQLPARNLKKPRPKKNLKALTRQIEPEMTSKDADSASIDKHQTPIVPHRNIVSPSSSADRLNRKLLPAETAFIKKNHRMADQYSDSMTSAAAQTSRQSDNSVSATALIMAKPLYMQNPAPAYPRKARRLGYEGMVMLKVLVDVNGRVDDLLVIESSGYPILDRTALTSVKKWLFAPGTEGGIKKKMWVRVPVRFRLE